ncbi:MAG: hypothetical protein KatS3mg039_1016 [Candidatus Kapaibacterium sp.]|nr:MAG: hypothetical protein KatS3mg039_1016 [Candidatus Kapabacteria bacterium]
MQRRTALGTSLILLGLALLGLLSVALLSFDHPVRIIVQAIANVLVMLAAILIYSIFRKEKHR